jgi:putative membrane protein
MSVSHVDRHVRRAARGMSHRARGMSHSLRAVSLAAIAGVIAMSRPAAALAHERGAVAPGEAWSAWNFDPAIILGLAFVALLYARGARALWARAGVSRGIRRWQAAAFAAGVIALFIALVSPIDSLGTTLFSAHMIQHLLLMQVAAPLLVLGAPPLALLWALPRSWRRALGASWRRLPRLQRFWRRLTTPAIALLIHAAALWLWHVPGMYDAALRYESLHVAEHASFLGSALLFWWVLLHGRARRLGYGAAFAAIFVVMMQSGVLGALMTFSGVPWYSSHLGGSVLWGLTPLEDQQLAGVIMWVPGNLLYLIPALALLAAWLHALERRMRDREVVAARRSQA